MRIKDAVCDRFRADTGNASAPIHAAEDAQMALNLALGSAAGFGFQNLEKFQPEA